MTDGQAAIRVSGLEKRYRSTQALAGLDFEIPSGRLTGFLGPNGAGKTTTFRSILGLTLPDAGDIEVLGSKVPSGLTEIVKRVGVIVEEPGLITALTGKTNLDIAADTLGFGHDRVDEMIDFVGLGDDALRKTGDYSKGMRQRLALAAAMLGDPEMLILDEPLDGLDPGGQLAFRARLKELTASGRTVVVSSHDLADIEALADYVVVIDEGRLVTQGTLEELLGEAGTHVAVADPGQAATVLERSGISTNIEPDGSLWVDSDDGAAIVETLARAGIYPSEVRLARSTLESRFMDITRGRDM
jgi:ABC-2 type transport system ATP-binding protein